MASRRVRSNEKRTNRHVVRTNDSEEAELQIRANAHGVTVARLLVESALRPPQDNSRTLLREVIGLRSQTQEELVLLRNSDFSKYADGVEHRNQKINAIAESLT